MSTLEKDLVWLPKPLAKKVKDVQDSKKLEVMILDYIKESKNALKEDIEEMDEYVIRYKGLMIQARNSLKEAKEEQLNATYELWESFEKDLPKLTKKTDKALKELKPLAEELDKINTTLKGIQTYDIEKLIKFINFFNDNVYGETENLLKYLMDTNYKAK